MVKSFQTQTLKPVQRPPQLNPHSVNLSHNTPLSIKTHSQFIINHNSSSFTNHQPNNRRPQLLSALTIWMSLVMRSFNRTKEQLKPRNQQVSYEIKRFAIKRMQSDLKVKNYFSLLEHVQKLMQEAEEQKNAETWITKEREETENEFHQLKVRFETYKQETESAHNRMTEELSAKVQELEAKLALKEQLSQAEGNQEVISTIHQQQIADQEIRMQQLQDKLQKQEQENKTVQQQIAKNVSEKDQLFKDLQHSISEKQKLKETIDNMSQLHKEELTRKTEIIGKKEKMNEQLQKKVAELLEEKTDFMEKCEELETKLKTTKEKVTELNSENDKFNNEYSDKVRDKELMIQKMNEELKHARSTARSQETTISYFKKKLEEMQKQLEQEKNEKLQIQGEMRRAEHLSSKASSPRNQSNHMSEEDFKSTQKMINDQSDFTDIKKLKLSQIDLDKPPRQSSHRIGSQKSITTSQVSPFPVQDSQLMDDLRKLREDYDTLARDYQELKRAKDKLEEELQYERTSQSSVKSKIQELEDKVDNQERTINELEKRREMAKKEIKMLNYKIEKMKLSGSIISNATNASNQSVNQSIEETKQSIKETITPAKSKTIATEESQVLTQNGSSGYTGLEKLKRIKREMEVFYKDLIKVLFLDQVDKQQAIQLEKTVNNLIMSINDQIDEIEIRQHKELGEIKVKEPQLEIKKQAVRAASTDVRSLPTKVQQQVQPQTQQSRPSMMGGLGNFIGQYNPYNQAPKTGIKTSLVGLPPQSPSQKGQPIKGMHRQ